MSRLVPITMTIDASIDLSSALLELFVALTVDAQAENTTAFLSVTRPFSEHLPSHTRLGDSRPTPKFRTDAEGTAMRILVAILCVSAGILSGCGGGDTEKTETETTTVTVTQTTTVRDTAAPGPTEVPSPTATGTVTVTPAR
jgi:hypothetical protein